MDLVVRNNRIGSDQGLFEAWSEDSEALMGLSGKIIEREVIEAFLKLVVKIFDSLDWI